MGQPIQRQRNVTDEDGRYDQVSRSFGSLAVGCLFDKPLRKRSTSIRVVGVEVTLTILEYYLNLFRAFLAAAETSSARNTHYRIEAIK